MPTLAPGYHEVYCLTCRRPVDLPTPVPEQANAIATEHQHRTGHQTQITIGGIS